METRCTKLNFEDFYSARALSTLKESTKEHSGVLRDTDYSVPVFQGCIRTEHQPHGSRSSGRGGMASGSSTTPATPLAGRCGVMAHGCVLGRQHLKISLLCCFPALQLIFSLNTCRVSTELGEGQKPSHTSRAL